MTESGEVDAAIVMRPVYSQDINEFLIIRERVVACVNKNHPWAKKEHVKISDFRNVPFVTFEEGFNLHTQMIRRLHEENIKPRFALTGADSQFLYRYAMCSDNILVLPEPMIKLACDDDPIKLIPFRPNCPWELSLIYKKHTYLSYASKALINEIQTAFST